MLAYLKAMMYNYKQKMIIYKLNRMENFMQEGGNIL